MTTEQASPACFPSPDALAVLRSAVVDCLGRRSPNGPIHQAIGVLVDDAHLRAAHAERVLIVFKDVWHDELRRIGGESTERNDMLSQLVTYSIERYFRGR